MNKAKIMEYFDASKINEPINIIGCGAVGSHIAETLTRIGCTNIILWDFDTVAPHNITNQLFTASDIGKPKVFAVLDLMLDINEDVTVTTMDAGWTEDSAPLEGHVFLCVDNIDLRRQIVEANKYNPMCLTFFDFRMRLTDAQHYLGTKADNFNKLLKTMNFSHEDAKDATPKSACNTELSVITTVKIITSLGVNNFIKLILELPTANTVLFDGALMTLDNF